MKIEVILIFLITFFYRINACTECVQISLYNDNICSIKTESSIFPCGSCGELSTYSFDLSNCSSDVVDVYSDSVCSVSYQSGDSFGNCTSLVLDYYEAECVPCPTTNATDSTHVFPIKKKDVEVGSIILASIFILMIIVAIVVAIYSWTNYKKYQ